MNLSELLNDKNRYDIEFNGEKGKNHGVIFYEFPKITYAKGKYDEISINGMRGNCITRYGGKNNAKIECTFAVINDAIHETIRELKAWLTGTGILKFTDRLESFYEVILVDGASFSRKSRKYGLFSVSFIIYPFEFLDSGQFALSAVVAGCNPYDECMPKYIIKGEGECVLSVNGKEFKADVPGYICIDSRRMISYKEDKSSANTLVTGDYEDLYLPNGACSISCTEGYDLKIIPNWGYDL